MSIRRLRFLSPLIPAVLIALCLAALASAAAAEPIPISTIEELQMISNDPAYPRDGHYILTNDIDASATREWNDGAGFDPIGYHHPAFSYDWHGFDGIMDGQGHVISGLYINRPDENYTGLFGFIGVPGQIMDLGLLNSEVTGLSSVGGLAGWNIGTLSRCYNIGHVTGDTLVGGLAGGNSFTDGISTCYSSGTVTGNAYVGGLVGYNYWGGKITSSFSTCDVSVTQHYAGGLVGAYEGGLISGCYATGAVTGGTYSIGGLIGRMTAKVLTASYATGAVTSSGENIGGLVGLLSTQDFVVTACFWDVEATRQSQSPAGKGMTSSQMQSRSPFQNAGWADWDWVMNEGEYPRLAWEDTDAAVLLAAEPVPLTGDGTAEAPFLITSADDLAVLNDFAETMSAHIALASDLDFASLPIRPVGDLGPFSGEFDGRQHSIRNLTLDYPEMQFLGLFRYIGPEGQVKNLGLEGGAVTGRDYAGSLAGFNMGAIDNCYATGPVTGGDAIGGLVGLLTGTIAHSHATGDVTANAAGGGLTGRSHLGGAITTSYASGAVTGSSHIGGLVGSLQLATITSSFATGNVVGDSQVGGLVGNNYRAQSGGQDWASMENCFAMGDVTGTTEVAGLVGYNYGWIINCYAAGQVTGEADTGGLVGTVFIGNLKQSYWDKESTGQNTSAGSGPIMGKTTEQMWRQDTFTGWDFSSTWTINEGEGYPYLRWTVSAPDPTWTPSPTPTPSPSPTPTIDLRPDLDGDGKPDVCEVEFPGPPETGQTSIFLPDSDGDGLLDGEEDPGDCEGVIGVLALTDPRNPDTDGNGIFDGIEVLVLGTDPLDPNDPPDATDSSGDGLPDFYAIALGLDPENPDNDGDGFTDAYELVMGTDPLDLTSQPTLGDVNGDGSTNNIDAVFLFNFLLGNNDAPPRLDRADVRTDGQINNLDAVVLFAWVLSVTPHMPVR